MEDEQLDELLRDVSVPNELRASLLSIPDQANVVIAPKPSRGKLWASLSVVASIAALVLVFLYSQPSEVTVIEKQDTETIELLLAEMEQNLESMNLIQQIYEHQQSQRRIQRAEPLLSVDESVALALSIPWKSSLDRGASIETVRTELEYVINTFPGTLGALEAETILQIN